ncbi:unnamed protein product, partial [marine sediment metagenome]
VIKRNPGAPLMKLIAKYSTTTGISRKTVTEYVKDLQLAGEIVIKISKVYIAEKEG